jgi:glycosyltransferase involved in cell wall biosynthesis
VKKVAVIIPCYNEAAAIAEVVAGFPQKRLKAAGYKLDIIVVDNRSTDRTAELARAAGARVVFEPRGGKGYAVKTGFRAVTPDTDFVVMLDGDGTYHPSEIMRLIEPLDSGFSNVVIGSRLGGRIAEKSMTGFNRLGNWVFSHLVRYSYRVNVTDVLTGYFAWRREVVEKLQPHLVSRGFAIEMEMITKMAKLGEEIFSVPISYTPRSGQTTHLRPVADGSRIMAMFARNLRWRPAEPRPQRIVFVSDAVWPYAKGGKEKRLHEISRRLVRADREVHVYTMKWWEGPNVMCRDGVFLHAISRMHPLYRHRRRSIRQALWFGLAPLKLMFVPFDILDVDSMPFFPLVSARIVTWVRRKKLHATWHEVTSRETWQQYLGVGGTIGYQVERFAQSLPDVIIANSAHTASRLREAGARQPINTVPLGVDFNQIYALSAASERYNVFFAGRLLAHKNVDVLLHAIHLARQTRPNVTAKIVGNGPEESRLKQLACELELMDAVTFSPFIEDHDELLSNMKASDVFVLPSVREGFSLVVVEANAVGVPVITTNHTNNAARHLIVEGANGYAVEPTAEALAVKILAVLGSGADLSPAAAVQEYDWNTVARSIEKAFGV